MSVIVKYVPSVPPEVLQKVADAIPQQVHFEKVGGRIVAGTVKPIVVQFLVPGCDDGSLRQHFFNLLLEGGVDVDEVDVVIFSDPDYWE